MSETNRPGGGASTAAFKIALAEHLSAEDMELWFRGVKCSLTHPESLEVELPNEHYAGWVREHYRAELEAAVMKAFGPVKVTLRAAGVSSEMAARAPNQTLGKESLNHCFQKKKLGQFMKIYYHWLDEIQPRIGVTAWVVFERLIRFIWRGDTHIDVLQSHVEQGDLVAYVSVGKLAQATGLGRRTVQRQLRKLEQLGLIQAIESSSPGQIRLYRLGREVDGEEIWLADQVAEKYRTGH